MTPRVVKNLTNMEIDEISLVDRGANQHATVSIAKRAPEEDIMPDLYDSEHNLVDQESLEVGDIVYDEEGNGYEVSAEDDGGDDEVQETAPELATVGKADKNKSAFAKRNTDKEQAVTKSFSDQVMEELSKAYSDEDRDQIFAKALGRVEELEKAQKAQESIAKQERDLRLTREYIAKADEYGLPIAADELGPVLYRAAEALSYEDCTVINKALEAAGSMLFEEIGYQGGGSNDSDIMQQVSAAADDAIAKSAGEDFSKAHAVTAVFDEAPEAYETYLADRRGY